MDKLLKYSLSDSDIEKFFDNNINIMRYQDLDKYDNISDIVGQYGCIILIEGPNNKNHWTLLQRVDKRKNNSFYLWFDSYGVFPSNELDNYYIPRGFKNQNKETLLKLLYNADLPVHFSQYRLQKLKSGINTCGRWCAIKNLFKNLDEDEFASMIKKMCKQTRLKTDEVICLLYEDLNQK